MRHGHQAELTELVHVAGLQRLRSLEFGRTSSTCNPISRQLHYREAVFTAVPGLLTLATEIAGK
jgi:hypothetical protein